MEKAYKGMMGGYTVWKKDDEKHTPTHMILTNEEYNKIVEGIRDLQEKLKNTEDACKVQISNIKADARAKVKAAQKEAEDQIAEANKRVEKAEQDRDDAVSLNANLKRICKENANAKRGIKPKKQHSGFVVLRTQETRDRIPLKKKGYEDIRVYKSVIETPYSTKHTILEADSMAWKDGLNQIFDIAWADHDRNDLISALDEEYKTKNVLYKQDYQTGKNGLWEIVCWHTKPIVMDKKVKKNNDGSIYSHILPGTELYFDE